MAPPRRADEDTSGVTSILVDMVKDVTRTQREHGEKLAVVSTTINQQTTQLQGVAASLEIIKTHIAECPARPGWEPLAAAVAELKNAQASTTKLLHKANIKNPSDDSQPFSIIPKNRKPVLSPVVERILYIAAAIGAAAAGYLAN